MSTQAATDTTTTTATPQPQGAPPQRGISRSTLIEERNRGMERGQRKLATELGFDSVEEMRAEFERMRGGKAKPAQSGGGIDGLELEEIVKRVVSERLAPLEQETAAQRQAREKQKQDEERTAKEQQEAAARKEREEAETAAAQKQLDEELRFVKKVAKGVGAKLDKENFPKLTKRIQAELNALDEDEFEEKFGEGVDEEDKAANLRALLSDIRKTRPTLFVEEDKPAGDAAAAAQAGGATATSGATGAAQQAQAQAAQPATTSRATSGPTTATPTSPATPRQLDVRKLSGKQFEEYKRNPTQFRTKFQAGLIDYDGKK